MKKIVLTDIREMASSTAEVPKLLSPTDVKVKILKPGGKLVLVGIPPSAEYTFNMDLMRRKELKVINVRRQNHCVEEAIDLVVSGRVDIEKMVTHHFSFDETAKAFDIVEEYKDGAIKAMIHL